jgi:hypothetical protein
MLYRHGTRHRRVGNSVLCLVWDHLISDRHSVSSVKALVPRLQWHDEELTRGAYRRWLLWQRSHFADPETREADFWRLHLDGTSPFRPIALPFYRDTSGALGPVLGTSVSFVVDKAEIAAARRHARSTEFIFLLAAAASAAGSVTSQDDLTFQVVAAGRGANYARTFGWFGNQVPVRLTRAGLDDPAVAFATARETWLDVLPNEVTPWDYIVEVSGGRPHGLPAATVTINFLAGEEGLRADMVDRTVTLSETCRGEGLWIDIRARPGGGYDLTCQYDSYQFAPGAIQLFLELIVSRWRWLLSHARSPALRPAVGN